MLPFLNRNALLFVPGTCFALGTGLGIHKAIINKDISYVPAGMIVGTSIAIMSPVLIPTMFINWSVNKLGLQMGKN
jgi:hypothetical protein